MFATNIKPKMKLTSGHIVVSLIILSLVSASFFRIGNTFSHSQKICFNVSGYLPQKTHRGDSLCKF